jgi:hypothetical protein
MLKWFYYTFTGTATRAAYCGSLLVGLRLPTHELEEHKGLRGLGRRSVTPYIHGRWLYCCVCVALFKAKLNLSAPVIRLTFYRSRSGSYTVT